MTDAYKPVFLLGAGCPRRLATELSGLGIPILTTWQGIDLVAEDNPAFCGRPGVIGQRAANIIQQMASHVWIFGARMDMEQVGHRPDRFAPHALILCHDIDRAELGKLPGRWNTMQIDLEHEAPFNEFLPDPAPKWLAWCKKLYARFRPELDGSSQVEDFIDPYYFTRRLSEALEEGDIIVPGSSGMQSCALMQAFKVKQDQRILLCNTVGAMGLEPMAIGAAIGTGKRVTCVTGDGGFFLNFQELEIVHRLGLDVKYFVFCNEGYGSISSMQDARFNLRVGADFESGFTLPDLARTAAVWGFAYNSLRTTADLDQLGPILRGKGASITRVNTSLAFRYACKVQSSLVDGRFVNDDMADMTPKITDLEELMRWPQ